MINNEDVARDLSCLVVPLVGSLEATEDLFVPYRLVDGRGSTVAPAAAFFAELMASGRPATTQRSYGMDLLRWFRFLWALGVGWNQATRVEARDFIRWLQVAAKPTRAHWRYPTGGSPGSGGDPAVARVNAVTGKPSGGDRYEPATVAHCESVLRGFYDFHLEAGTGPMLNPFPLARHARAGRAGAHRSPMEPFGREPRGRYRPKLVTRAPRSIPDERFDELFAQLGSHRDRALVAFWVSTGARASELLGATAGDVDPGQQLITVMRKGTRVMQPLPAAPDAFVWLRLYQAQLEDLAPAGRDEPLWWTLRRPFRALGYDAARAMFTRANAALGANWSLHDLRHTAACRMARDPQMPLTDVQWVLICADVIRPGLGWLLRFAPARRNLAIEMARTRDSSAFAELAESCTRAQVGLQSGQQALTHIAMIMAAKGGPVSEVRVGDCVQMLEAAAGLRASSGLEAHATSPLFYQLLHAHGVLGEDAPAAIEVFSGRGQPSCEQLIDRYRIACRPVRDVLVDYLRERQPAVDFSSLQRLAYLLGKLFWADLEAHHPGIDSLKLPRDTAAAWKQRVMTRTRTTAGPGGEQITLTTPRLDGRSVLSAVRAFYLDIAEWADEDPARWGPWAVRCPVAASDVSHKKDRSRRKSRMDQRTRERMPVLPALVSWVEAERARTTELLAATQAAAPGELFTTSTGQTLRRAAMRTESTGRVWAEHPDTGQRLDVTFEEHRGFWTWAMVEVLRHTGLRIEELTELSHHSLIQYRLPGTGELIPLLQIAPSKTDAERLLVISPELADALSAIVTRIRAGQQQVPLVVSYDKNERVYNPPMPLLFQWRRRLENRTVSERALRSYLDHALSALGVKDASGHPMRYTFHDFRRLFITDAIMHGMPPHIAQLVAGHRDINTTMGYKAVYPEEVINTHRAFLARRRAIRPNEEYRTPTDEEWDQFIGHFEHRKVSLGDCGRSYDTPCIHEHSCLRCPLLRPDPDARQRLAQIRDNLIARIAEAEANRWLGEAEGLKVSLAGARAKLAQMDQISARRQQSVQLGIPTFTDTAGRASTGRPNNPPG